MYNAMGLYQNFYPAMGVIHEKILMRIYAQKAAPGLHKGKNSFKKFSFPFAANNGGYTRRGLYTRGLYIRHYSNWSQIQVILHISLSRGPCSSISGQNSCPHMGHNPPDSLVD